MIEKEIFAQAMGLLADRFNRPLHPGTTRMYYEILSEELDTDQVMIAARLAIRHEQFWPSPQQLINYVKRPVDLNGQALRMFDALIELGHEEPGRARYWRREEIESELGEAGYFAFKRIGGQDRLREMDAKDLTFCRREFVAAYTLKATETKAEKEIAAVRASIAAPRKALRSAPVAIGSVIRNEVAGIGQ